MSQATASALAKIDVSPSGIKITFEGIDSDLASLIKAANDFTAGTPVYRTYDLSDLVLSSTKVIQFVEPEPEA